MDTTDTEKVTPHSKARTPELCKGRSDKPDIYR